MIRLFVGIELPETVKDQLLSFAGGLAGASWRTRERLHITLRFIGNVDEQTAEDIAQELRYMRFPAFHLRCKELGCFDIGGTPHHLWAGLDNTKVLQELHDKIDTAVKRAGGGNQSSFKFTPHVTLAKLNGTSMQEVYEFIAAHNLYPSDSFLAESVTLFASRARENGEGKYYIPLQRFPLSLV